MSATQTPSNTLKRQGLSGRFWSVSLLTLLAAVIINTLIVLAAHAVLTVAPTFTPLQFEAFIPATVVAVAGAIIVFAQISRRSQQPAPLFRRIAVGVLIISIIPGLLLPTIGLFPGTMLPEVGAVLLMHIATAVLCISTLPRSIDARV